jgi:hypothetical protein
MAHLPVQVSVGRGEFRACRARLKKKSDKRREEMRKLNVAIVVMVTAFLGLLFMAGIATRSEREGETVAPAVDTGAVQRLAFTCNALAYAPASSLSARDQRDIEECKAFGMWP